MGRKIYYMKLSIVAGAEYQEKVYFTTYRNQGLFSLDLCTNKVEFIKFFDEDRPVYTLYSNAFVYKEEIWFIPYNAKKIAIVDIESFEISYLNLIYSNEIEIEKNEVDAKYFSANIFEEKYLYMIPCTVDTLLIVDMESKEIVPYYDFVCKGECYGYGAYDYDDNAIWVYPYKGNYIKKLLLENGQVEKFEWNIISKYQYGSMDYYEGKLWFVPCEADKILSIDVHNMQREYIELPSWKTDLTFQYGKIIQDVFIMFGRDADSVGVYNLSDREIKCYHFLSRKNEKQVGLLKPLFSEGKIILSMLNQNKNLLVCNNDFSSTFSVNADIYNISNKEYFRNNLCYEGEISLRDYMDII